MDEPVINRPTTEEPRFGSDSKTVEELFSMYHGHPLPPDPSMSQVRARLVYLSKSMSGIMYEKSDAYINGRKNETGLWNNLQTMVHSELKALETVAVLLCSEAKLTE